jgi:hypothetical protein
MDFLGNCAQDKAVLALGEIVQETVEEHVYGEMRQALDTTFVMDGVTPSSFMRFGDISEEESHKVTVITGFGPNDNGYLQADHAGVYRLTIDVTPTLTNPDPGEGLRVIEMQLFINNNEQVGNEYLINVRHPQQSYSYSFHKYQDLAADDIIDWRFRYVSGIAGTLRFERMHASMSAHLVIPP